MGNVDSNLPSDTLSDPFVGESVTIGYHHLNVVRKIAEGGFANVYIVRSMSSGENFVLKRMHAASAIVRAQVVQELTLMDSLNHENIVKCLGHAERSDGHGQSEILILMEYCEGGHVLNAMHALGERYLRDRRVAEVFLEIVKAVHYLHQRDPPIAHRDLKLENILITRSNQFKLCDFGSCSTWSGVVPKEKRGEIEEEIERFTTPTYRAPEQVDLYSGHSIDHRVDVWALGIILYALCYFQHPFEEAGNLGIINGNYRLPETPKRTAELVFLIRRCLQVSPDDRISTADLISYLNFILDRPDGKPLPSEAEMAAMEKATRRGSVKDAPTIQFAVAHSIGAPRAVPVVDEALKSAPKSAALRRRLARQRGSVEGAAAEASFSSPAASGGAGGGSNPTSAVAAFGEFGDDSFGGAGMLPNGANPQSSSVSTGSFAGFGDGSAAFAALAGADMSTSTGPAPPSPRGTATQGHPPPPSPPGPVVSAGPAPPSPSFGGETAEPAAFPIAGTSTDATFGEWNAAAPATSSAVSSNNLVGDPFASSSDPFGETDKEAGATATLPDDGFASFAADPFSADSGLPSQPVETSAASSGVFDLDLFSTEPSKGASFNAGQVAVAAASDPFAAPVGALPATAAVADAQARGADPFANPPQVATRPMAMSSAGVGVSAAFADLDIAAGGAAPGWGHAGSISAPIHSAMPPAVPSAHGRSGPASGRFALHSGAMGSGMGPRGVAAGPDVSRGYPAMARTAPQGPGTSSAALPGGFSGNRWR